MASFLHHGDVVGPLQQPFRGVPAGEDQFGPLRSPVQKLLQRLPVQKAVLQCGHHLVQHQEAALFPGQFRPLAEVPVVYLPAAGPFLRGHGGGKTRPGLAPQDGDPRQPGEDLHLPGGAVFHQLHKDHRDAPARRPHRQPHGGGGLALARPGVDVDKPQSCHIPSSSIR